jgi:Cu/Ag efflux pump CusA
VNVSRWGVNNPVAAVIIFIVMCLAGLIGWRQLAIAVLPDFKVPEITITVTLPGAAPAQLETDVTRKIEDAVATLIDVDKVLSTITEGRSATRIQFDLGRDMNLAIEQVRDAIDRIRVDLPQDIDEPEIARVNAIGGSLLSYAVLSDRLATDELSWFVDDTVRIFSRWRAGPRSPCRIAARCAAVLRHYRRHRLSPAGAHPGRAVGRPHHTGRRSAGRTHPGRGEKCRRAGELPHRPA